KDIMRAFSARAGYPGSPFHAVLSNRCDGASALFSQFVQLAQGHSRDTILAGLQACQKTFPLMAVWPYALAQLTQKRHDLKHTAALMAQQTRATIERAAVILKDYQSVLTLSNSSVVRRAILLAHTPPQVLCAVSDPGGEGHILSKALTAAGAKARLIADDQLPRKMADVQVVLLGADQYDDTGFINKVGSRDLALQARRLDKPVLVLAEEFKRVSQLPELTPELASLDLETGGLVSRQQVFEQVQWQSHIRLISNARQ
ncbi:MAG: hypothetical protein ACETWG_12970, partial [Candidatus Neomarinimicrobiota bacterium]